MSPMSKLDGIEVFVRVAQAGSFSAAARLLKMPVTTISGQIASLEKRLGVTLIHRTTRKLSITKAGETYLNHCILALEEMSAAELELATEQSEPEGLLRITAPPDIGHTLLPPIIRHYLKCYPNVKVELLLTNRVVDLIGEGVDLAFRVGPLKNSNLIAKKFLNADFGLWASTAYIKKFGLPTHPKNLSEHAIIGMKAYPYLTLTKGKQSVRMDVEPRIIANDIETVKVFVVAGDGIAFLPSFICENEIASRTVVKVLPDWQSQLGPTAEVWFIYPPQRFVPQKLRAFIDIASQAAT